MVALTPALSWLLLLAIGIGGAALALYFARWYDQKEADREAMEAWRRMCEALDLRPYDQDDKEAP